MKNVSFSYGSQNVIEDVTFSVSKGELIGLVGPNGGGKTTLLKLIVGLLKPGAGRIEVVGTADKKPTISYMSQNAQRIDPNFPATVKEIIETGLYGKLGFFGRLSNSDKLAIETAIKNVGLAKLKGSQITELSGGQLQKVFIARALVSNPSILILDEPTTGVDAEGEEAFYMLMKRINELYGVTVILVSHDVYALIDHTDRLMFLNKKLLYDGKPKELDSSRLLNLLFYHKHSKEMIARLERSLRIRSKQKAGIKSMVE